MVGSRRVGKRFWIGIHCSSGFGIEFYNTRDGELVQGRERERERDE